jgi:hypothetical protein
MSMITASSNISPMAEPTPIPATAVTESLAGFDGEAPDTVDVDSALTNAGPGMATISMN